VGTVIHNVDCRNGCKEYLENDSVDLIVTDPPYNLGFGGTKLTKTKKPRFDVIANDHLTQQDYQRFTYEWLYQAHRVLKPGRHIYVFIDWRMYDLIVNWMRRVGFVVKNCIVWDKAHMGMGWQYRYRHEFIIFAVKGKKNVRRIPTRTETDIWKIPRISGNKTIHPTEKPLEIMERIILNSSEPGEHVVDLFVGSGPSAEAAHKCNRNFTGFEVDPIWHKVASEREKKPSKLEGCQHHEGISDYIL